MQGVADVFKFEINICKVIQTKENSLRWTTKPMRK